MKIHTSFYQYQQGKVLAIYLADIVTDVTN